MSLTSSRLDGRVIAVVVAVVVTPCEVESGVFATFSTVAAFIKGGLLLLLLLLLLL